MSTEETILTKNQKESIVNHFIKIIESGHNFIFINKNTLNLKTKDHIFTIRISLFGSGMNIFRLDIFSKKNSKLFKINYSDINYMNNINIIQNVVDNILLVNTSSEFSDKEFDTLLGFDDVLLKQRDKKLDHLIDNITEKKKRTFFKRRK